MSSLDPADVLVARAADRIAVIAMRGDAAAALDLCRQLHDLRADVVVSLRCDNNPPDARARTPMPARFAGRCAACATAIGVGTPIYYDSDTRKAVHARCA